MEVELKSAKEKIKQLEHEIKEDRKMSEIKHQEGVLQAEKYEEVIMKMAREIKNLQEGKDTEFADQKDKALENANKQLQEIIKEKEDLKEKLEEAVKNNEKVTQNPNILTKVVESVKGNIGGQFRSHHIGEKNKNNKKNIKCRNIGKPDGCSWGIKCKFDHGNERGLENQEDCSYWMVGHCRFTEEVCWNIHNPVMKGSKSKEVQDAGQLGFLEGQEEESVPPGEQNAAGRMDGEGWIHPSSRKSKRKVRATKQNMEVSRAGKPTPACPVIGESAQNTPQFPVAGDPTQQILLQTLAVLLQQAGLGQ